MKWSVEGQSPEYLAVTRMVTLSPRVVSMILDHVHLEPGMRVLDVGCGSGEYVFRLGRQVKGIDFVGLDYDQGFVDLANERVAGRADALFEPIDPQNTYVFLQGDGLRLPFADGAFDAVISHTYLTAIPDYQGALAEMIRVCKPGGQVSSITNLNSNFGGTGGFNLFPPVVDASICNLVSRVADLKREMSYIDMGSGVPTHKVQRLFAHLCLDEVSAVPLGQYFCLSDAQTTREDYERYVNLLYRIECADVARMRETPACAKVLDAQDWDDYLSFAEMRRDALLDMRGKNQEWTWFGSAALLVWGRVPESGLLSLCESIAEEREPVEALRGRAADDGLRVSERVAQAGPGRVCRVRLAVEGEASPRKGSKKRKKRKGAGLARTRVVEASGFNPSLALEEAYAEVLGIGAGEQKRCRAIEKAAKKARSKGKLKLRSLPDDDIYSLDLMWDTVAEALELGWGVAFSESKPVDGYAVVCCEVTVGGERKRAFAAHLDRDVAIQRALSRALAKFAPPFL